MRALVEAGTDIRRHGHAYNTDCRNDDGALMANITADTGSVSFVSPVLRLTAAAGDAGWWNR
jgi:hypothetical protein